MADDDDKFIQPEGTNGRADAPVRAGARPIELHLFSLLTVMATSGFNPLPRRTKVMSLLLVAALAAISRVTHLTTQETGILILLVGSPAYAAVLLLPSERDAPEWQRSRLFGTLLYGGMPAMAFMHWGTLLAAESLRIGGASLLATTALQVCGVAAGVVLCQLGILLLERVNPALIFFMLLIPVVAPLVFFLSWQSPWQTWLVWSLYLPAELARFFWQRRRGELAERRSKASTLPPLSDAIEELKQLTNSPSAKEALFTEQLRGARHAGSTGSWAPGALVVLVFATVGTLGHPDSNQAALALGLALLLLTVVHRSTPMPGWVSVTCFVGMLLLSFLSPLRDALELGPDWAVRVWPVERYAFVLTLVCAVISMFQSLSRARYRLGTPGE